MNSKEIKLERFGKYIFLQKLAEGGMAEVYLARPANCDGNGRLEVVKRILPQIASQAEFINMFQREIQIIMGFNHSHVVQLHDFGTFMRQPYIAMEYIEGKNLKMVLDKLNSTNHKMPVPMALSLVVQAASGLHYAHTFVNKITGENLKIVHRDISPHNLIVSYDGNLKVIDFGIAKAACSLQELTRAGTVKGKAAYFSPEQVTGKKVDARTDIFALGAVAWELMTGERLFAKPGDNELTAIQKISNCDKHVISPSKLNNQIPPEVDQIIMTALEKDPEDRYQTARDFQNALRKALVKHYPAYTYAETGRLVSAIFADEIAKDNMRVRAINLLAQRELMGTGDDKTVTVATDQTGSAIRSISTNTYDTTQASLVDFRLSKIESMLKQRATGRHYAMLAFYIVSLVALKITENYDFGFEFTPQSVQAAEIPSPQIPTQPVPDPRPSAAAQAHAIAQPISQRNAAQRPPVQQPPGVQPHTQHQGTSAYRAYPGQPAHSVNANARPRTAAYQPPAAKPQQRQAQKATRQLKQPARATRRPASAKTSKPTYKRTAQRTQKVAPKKRPTQKNQRNTSRHKK